nr:DUF1934 family protein [Streptococcus sp. S784/96/1]
MKIMIKNKIQMGNEMELIHEEYEGELTLKGDYHYLVYQNEETEKVILKFKSDELLMTRFSKPQSLMRFVADDLALCSIPTPMGTQKMVTKTHRFELGQDVLTLSYELLPHMDSKEALATYQMSISWL